MGILWTHTGAVGCIVLSTWMRYKNLLHNKKGLVPYTLTGAYGSKEV